MSETADSPAPQGSEQSRRVELSGPTFQPDENAPREEQPLPDLDQRQAAIRTERRAAGPESINQDQQEALENEPLRNDNVPETDPAESSQE
ncbi:hypothetical protein QF031_000687 [Pseudarthrobacter defluvii]|uniref:hypothetical protein n=1 Tax=Pseudarthrobacter defluvii TaxID=410837 RepID=UPI0027819139|nr:hypothetical protein [Pseudarthrobacter defluvii]MDQ0767938.1 hypothetical protein [Pseudarthrobacter defluvii]